MSTSILESAPTSDYFLRSHSVRPIGWPAVRSFVRSFPSQLGSCALVSIPRMGLMGTLCVGSAEKRAGSIRGTGGPRVLSCFWWGVVLDDRRDTLGPGGGGTREGPRRATLSSLPSPSTGPPTLSDLVRTRASSTELTVSITILRFPGPLALFFNS